jgi:hypothetical protein
MKNIIKITLAGFAFAFILFGVDTANAQYYRQNRREVRREYRRDMREARRDYQRRLRNGNYRKAVREYREDLRDARRERRQTRRGYYLNRRYYTNRGLLGNGTRYYYYNGRMIRRW